MVIDGKKAPDICESLYLDNADLSAERYRLFAPLGEMPADGRSLKQS